MQPEPMIEETEEIDESRTTTQDEKQLAVTESYEMWKRNSPLLYDLLITHELLWPSLSVQWMPARVDSPEPNYNIQRMVLGTHTSGGEQNFLMIAESRLPVEEHELGDEQPGGDEGLEGVGGATSVEGNVRVVQVIHHDGEVNNARCMPQNPSIIATKTVTSDIFIFDHTKHPPKPRAEGLCEPELRLKGHVMQGFSLAWSPKRHGLLLSGSDDKRVCLWDIEAFGTGRRSLQALRTFAHHEGSVGDVGWHCKHPTTFGSVGDDRQLAMWDTRTGGLVDSAKIHKAEVNCLAFNPFHDHVLLTGSTDTTVLLHDLRKLGTPLHSFARHTDGVSQLEWSPHCETVFASCSDDRRVVIWDVSKIDAPQSVDDAEDGPPELMFVHAGHTARISDFSWSPNPVCEWVCASVAEDNMLHIWQVAEGISGDWMGTY